jgi:hypothetical protein
LGKNAAEVFGSPGIINVFMVLSFRRDGVTTAYQSLRSSAALKTKFFGSIALAVPTAILAEDTRTGPVFNGDPAQSCEFRLYLRQYVLNKAVKYVLPDSPGTVLKARKNADNNYRRVISSSSLLPAEDS